jgi:hypothetical protein
VAAVVGAAVEEGVGATVATLLGVAAPPLAVLFDDPHAARAATGRMSRAAFSTAIRPRGEFMTDTAATWEGCAACRP